MSDATELFFQQQLPALVAASPCFEGTGAMRLAAELKNWESANQLTAFFTYLQEKYEPLTRQTTPENPGEVARQVVSQRVRMYLESVFQDARTTDSDLTRVFRIPGVKDALMHLLALHGYETIKPIAHALQEESWDGIYRQQYSLHLQTTPFPVLRERAPVKHDEYWVSDVRHVGVYKKTDLARTRKLGEQEATDLSDYLDGLYDANARLLIGEGRYKALQERLSGTQEVSSTTPFLWSAPFHSYEKYPWDWKLIQVMIFPLETRREDRSHVHRVPWRDYNESYNMFIREVVTSSNACLEKKIGALCDRDIPHALALHLNIVFPRYAESHPIPQTPRQESFSSDDIPAIQTYTMAEVLPAVMTAAGIARDKAQVFKNVFNKSGAIKSLSQDSYEAGLVQRALDELSGSTEEIYHQKDYDSPLSILNSLIHRREHGITDDVISNHFPSDVMDNFLTPKGRAILLAIAHYKATQEVAAKSYELSRIGSDASRFFEDVGKAYHHSRRDDWNIHSWVQDNARYVTGLHVKDVAQPVIEGVIGSALKDIRQRIHTG